MRFLLDTNILIALTRERPGLAERLSGYSSSSIILSSVVVAEIEYGIAKSARPEHNRRVFDLLLAHFNILPFDANAAQHYGPIRATLERQGKLIGPYDLMIAAHAIAVDAVLVTDNQQEFNRVAGLTTENWLR